MTQFYAVQLVTCILKPKKITNLYAVIKRKRLINVQLVMSVLETVGRRNKQFVVVKRKNFILCGTVVKCTYLIKQFAPTKIGD